LAIPQRQKRSTASSKSGGSSGGGSGGEGFRNRDFSGSKSPRIRKTGSGGMGGINK
jgi:hypothetical protein